VCYFSSNWDGWKSTNNIKLLSFIFYKVNCGLCRDAIVNEQFKNKIKLGYSSTSTLQQNVRHVAKTICHRTYYHWKVNKSQGQERKDCMEGQESLRTVSGSEWCNCVIKVAAGDAHSIVALQSHVPSSSASLSWIQNSSSNALVAGHRKSPVLLTRRPAMGRTRAAGQSASTRPPGRYCSTPPPLIWPL